MKAILVVALLSCVFGTLVLPDHIPEKNDDTDPTFIPDPAPPVIKLSSGFVRNLKERRKEDAKMLPSSTEFSTTDKLHREWQRRALEKLTKGKSSFQFDEKKPKSEKKVTTREMIEERLTAVHSELEFLIAERDKCNNDKACVWEITDSDHITFEEQSELLLMNARDHVALGNWFRKLSDCPEKSCSDTCFDNIRRLEEAIEERSQGHFGVYGKIEQNPQDELLAKLMDKRKAEVERFDESKLTPAERIRRHRMLDLAEHFHRLGDAFDRAADCKNKACRDGQNQEIKDLREQGKRLRDGLNGPKKVPKTVLLFREQMRKKAQRHSYIKNLYQHAAMCNSKKCLMAHTRMIKAVERTQLVHANSSIEKSINHIEKRGSLHDSLAKLYRRASHCKDMKCMLKYQKRIRKLSVKLSRMKFMKSSKSDKYTVSTSRKHSNKLLRLEASQRILQEHEEYKIRKAIFDSSKPIGDEEALRDSSYDDDDGDDDDSDHGYFHHVPYDPLHFEPDEPTSHIQFLYENLNRDEVHAKYMPTLDNLSSSS